MEEKQFKQLMNILKNIDLKLSVLISLEKSSSKPPTLGKEEKEILKLCNGKNSVVDIMKATKKARANVESRLSRLRKKGMIKSTTLNKKIVYVKI